jgi:cell division protein FtsN
MAKDYKRTKQAVKKGHSSHKRSTSLNLVALKWISIGVVIGISIIVIMPHLPVGNLANQMKNMTFAAVAQKKKTETAPKRDLTQAEKKQPSFDFYTLLPEMKVEIPAKEETKAKAVAQAAPTQPAATPPIAKTTTPAVPTPTKQANATRYAPPPSQKRGSGYNVQIASFKNFSDADAVKTQLLVSGFPVRLQTSTSSTGELLHLIKMGPYKNKDFAQRDRQRLVAMNYKQAVIIEDN